MNLIPIEHQSQMVLTTAQLAEQYDTDERRISENFNRNRDRYMEGKHFFALQGEEKRAFRTIRKLRMVQNMHQSSIFGPKKAPGSMPNHSTQTAHGKRTKCWLMSITALNTIP